jgi:hypothetical protein
MTSQWMYSTGLWLQLQLLTECCTPLAAAAVTGLQFCSKACAMLGVSSCPCLMLLEAALPATETFLSGAPATVATGCKKRVLGPCTDCL